MIDLTLSSTMWVPILRSDYVGSRQVSPASTSRATHFWDVLKLVCNKIDLYTMSA